MKSLGILFFILPLSISTIHSQEQPDKLVAYKAWVTTLNGSQLEGVLFYANEDVVTITDGFKASKKKELITIPYHDLGVIKLQRRGVKTKGAVIGGLIGVGLALLLTKDVSDSSSWLFGDIAREAIVLGYVVGFAVEGAVIGAKLSDKNTQLYFNGNEYAYKNQLNRLKEFCLVREQSTSEVSDN